MPYGTVNADSITDSNGSVFSPSSSLFKNRIINGSMSISQGAAGATITPAVTSAYATNYPVDRFQVIVGAASKLTTAQSSTAATGFNFSTLITSSSAYTVGAGEVFAIRQNIEGFNTADLAFGTANAASITLSFWVRSSLTGTFGGSLQNSASDRSYPFTYTISSANTFEKKTVTIAGDTSGTWIGATNGIGLRVNFGLGVGSTFSGTAGAWAAGDFDSATGATSVVGTNGATFYITGVQLEKGTTATSFDYRPYGTELALCQRYYYRQKPSINVRFCPSYNATTTSAVGVLELPVTMRTAPSALEQTGTASDYGVAYLTTAAACSSVPVFSLASTDSVYLSFTVASGLTAGQGSTLYNNTANGYLGFSAEL